MALLALSGISVIFSIISVFYFVIPTLSKWEKLKTLFFAYEEYEDAKQITKSCFILRIILKINTALL
jgi:hypothetical protein